MSLSLFVVVLIWFSVSLDAYSSGLIRLFRHHMIWRGVCSSQPFEVHLPIADRPSGFLWRSSKRSALPRRWIIEAHHSYRCYRPIRDPTFPIRATRPCQGRHDPSGTASGWIWFMTGRPVPARTRTKGPTLPGKVNRWRRPLDEEASWGA